jgi:hypothetical protein
MANEYLIFNYYTLADERVGGNLAASADDSVFLYLDECTDSGVISDGTAVEVDERRLEYLYVFPHPDAICDRHDPLLLIRCCRL